MLAGTGARFSQAARIQVCDLKRASRVMVPASQKGKGAKARTKIAVPLGDDVIARLAPLTEGRKGHERCWSAGCTNRSHQWNGGACGACLGSTPAKCCADEAALDAVGVAYVSPMHCGTVQSSGCSVQAFPCGSWPGCMTPRRNDRATLQRTHSRHGRRIGTQGIGTAGERSACEPGGGCLMAKPKNPAPRFPSRTDWPVRNKAARGVPSVLFPRRSPSLRSER